MELPTDLANQERTVSQKQTGITANNVLVSAQAHGACLTLNDHDRIRQFIQEFTFRGLLPHIEKNIRQLNDQVFNLTLTRCWSTEK